MCQCTQPISFQVSLGFPIIPYVLVISMQMVAECSLQNFLYSRNRCTEDYVQIYRGASTSSSKSIRYVGFTGGRICNRKHTRFTFFTTERIVTVYYHTNGRNFRSDITGLQIAYDLRGIYKFCLPFCSTMLHIILNKQNNGILLNNTLFVVSNNVILCTVDL